MVSVWRCGMIETASALEESWIEHAQHLLGCYMAQELIMDNEVGAFQIVQAVNRLRKIG